MWTLVDLISGCGCGGAVPKSDCEPAMMALQKAVKNTRQSDTLQENSRTGDRRSNGAAENVREAEGMTRTWVVFVQDKTNTGIDNKHVLLPWCVSHAGVIITRYEEAFDGKTTYQKIKNRRPSNH